MKDCIKFVVMVTPEDMKANAEYIKLADYTARDKYIFVCIKI